MPYNKSTMVKIPLMIIAIILSLALVPASQCAADNTIAGEQSSFLLARKPGTPQPRLPYIKHNRPSAGKFLVASRHMNDPRFEKSVILLIKYNWEGAMGVIINRPTRIKLSEAFPELKGFSTKEDTIFWGGPVSMDHIGMLIRSDSKEKETVHIQDDIYFTASQAILERISDANESPEQYRVYAGYSGWSPGQLDHEILRGDWKVIGADAETVFSKKPDGVWNKLILLDPGQQVMVH